MPKFKLRKGKIKEFSHCIDCWNAQCSNAGNTIRAIFDVIGGISHNYDTPSSVPWPKGTTLLKKPVPLARYFFNGTYGWMVNKSCHTQLQLNSSYQSTNLTTTTSTCLVQGLHQLKFLPLLVQEPNYPLCLWLQRIIFVTNKEDVCSQ